MKTFLIIVIKTYRLCIAPFVPSQCRYYPTCSHYMEEAIIKLGIFRGVWCGFKRILRCNPFFPGGYDPVPERRNMNG